MVVRYKASTANREIPDGHDPRNGPIRAVMDACRCLQGRSLGNAVTELLAGCIAVLEV